jgi:hypothetical protein
MHFKIDHMYRYGPCRREFFQKTRVTYCYITTGFKFVGIMGKIVKMNGIWRDVVLMERRKQELGNGFNIMGKNNGPAGI